MAGRQAGRLVSNKQWRPIQSLFNC
jgi:hypothetical protein